MQFRELTDRYQLQKILKSTRFGTVLRATDVASGRTVIVKLITVGPTPGLAAGAPEFEKLASALAGLAHPNLPAVFDSGFTTDGSAFLVLELVEGRSFDTLAGEPPTQVVALMSQALAGLAALAGRGLAHHNVSPDNLLLAGGPGEEQVKLLGLGTAVFRARGPAAASGLGPENARFRAPELAAGGAADWRADLFSLALTTCQGLSATVGFGESPVVQLSLAVSFELDNDDALRKGLERALRQRPGERPTPRELHEAFRLAAGAAAFAVPTPPPQPAPAPPTAPPPSPTVPTVMPFQPPAPVRPASAQAPTPLPHPDTKAPAAAPQPHPTPSLSAAPAPLSPPEPPADGEVLSAVSDEVLDALLSDPASSHRSAGSSASSAEGRVVPFQRPSGAPAAHAAPAPAVSRPRLRRPAVLAAIAGAVMLLGIGALAAFWLLRPPSKPAVAAPAPPPVFLPKPPSQPPLERLEEAKLYLAEGEDRKARRTLRGISFGEQGLLSAAGCQELSAIEETLNLAALEHLPADLANGLKAGDLEALQAAVEAAAGQEASLAPEIRANLDRARQAVEAYGQTLAAAAQGQHAQVLERFAALAALLPKASDPDDLRGQAAQALETEADGLVQNAGYADALARLASLQRSWPERPGLKERITRFETFQQNEAQQETLLAALPAAERHKKPWDGLQMLEGVEPTPHLAPRFAEARVRLQDLLSRLDKEPPKLVLRDGFLLEFARGTVAELSFRATDDYQVKEVKLWARPQGGKFRELPLEITRTGYYTVEIPAAFHHNNNVDLFAVVSDLSGHEAGLGSREQPLQLKRKQGFERLIR